MKFDPIQVYLLGLLRYSEKEFMIKPICSFLGLISLFNLNIAVFDVTTDLIITVFEAVVNIVEELLFRTSCHCLEKDKDEMLK